MTSKVNVARSRDQSEASWPNAVPVSLEAGGGIPCRLNPAATVLVIVAINYWYELHVLWQDLDSLQTDVILSGRNALFLRLVNSSLQSAEVSLSSAVLSLYQQQPDLLHLEPLYSTAARHSVSDKGAVQQSRYIIRIPAERREDTESVRKAVVYRVQPYSSTDLLSS